MPLRLCISTWAETAPDERIDIDIRYGDGRWPAEKIRRLTKSGSVLVCPPDTVFGPDPIDALRPRLASGAIHIMGCESFWDGFARAEGLAADEIGRGISVDSSLVALGMVASGLGMALIARDLAESFSRSGRVRIVPGMTLRHEQAHYLLMTMQDLVRPESYLFRDWLLDEMYQSGLDPRDAAR